LQDYKANRRVHQKIFYLAAPDIKKEL
jgi:hypothetical protein